MARKKNNTTTNTTLNELTKKALETAQTEEKTEKTEEKTEKTVDETAKTEDKTEDKKAKTYTDAIVNKDKVTKEIAKALDADKKAIKEKLATYTKEDKTITINIDYKKAKITVKKANKLIARMNKRKNDFYLRTYKDSKETITKNQSLDNCTKAIEKLLK